MSIFYVIESQKHYKCDKIIFKIYLKILRIKKIELNFQEQFIISSIIFISDA
jgi:hypothetical protein